MLFIGSCSDCSCGGCGSSSARTDVAEAGPPICDVAVIPKGTTHEFWKSIHAGANKAASELGVRVTWRGPVREDDRDEQIRVVEDSITRRACGIVIAPLDDTALVPVLREATAQHIPVVIIDSGIQWDGMVSFVATDNRRGGQMAGERMGDLLQGRGKVILLRYQEGSASTMEREAGFLQAIARYPGIEVVSSNRYGGATTETAYAAAENLLVTFREVDGIFTPNESTTFGMLRALQDGNRAEQVKFVGFDSSPTLVQALRAGQLHGLVVQNPFRMGELGVQTLVQHVRNQPVERRIDTGVAIISAQTVDSAEVQNLLSPDLGRWLRE